MVVGTVKLLPQHFQKFDSFVDTALNSVTRYEQNLEVHCFLIKQWTSKFCSYLVSPFPLFP